MFGLFKKFREGLSKSSSALTTGIRQLFGSGKIDAAALEELEELLIQADMGVDTALSIVGALRNHRFDGEINAETVRRWLAVHINQRLQAVAAPFALPQPEKGVCVVLFVGVNGAGKTTSIGKLAAQFKEQGHKVLLAAGDTFRAGAVQQLQVWAERAGVDIITPQSENADPAGVLFQAYEKAQAGGHTVLLADTAGRLQNRKDLMDQLAKMVRVLRKHDATAPHATLLVLDATVGQNAFSQVKAFREIADVKGLVLTKLDSSAKGGVVVGLADTFKLPIYFLGVGEKITDLEAFNPGAFAYGLLDMPPPATEQAA